jgi:2,4-dienoyl-CoA reductase-like NADH-dependent reductase (Old Yellow Enzyme family)/thioredoxin reductase
MDGCVTDRVIRHYTEQAKGGASLVTIDCVYIGDEASKESENELGLSVNDFRAGMQWLAATIKAHGAKSCVQLEHAGIQRFPGVAPIKGPSAVPWEEIPPGAPPPEELTIQEIQEIVQQFGDAALRSQECDFDAVEVHCGHGYLLTNFLSSVRNRRNDIYGGSLENRTRIVLEIIDDIRKKTGSDYPILVRVTCTDYEEGGISIDDTKVLCQALEKAGVNMIHVSGGTHHVIDHEHAPTYGPLANNVWAADEIKKVLKIPVVASGSITTPELAEQILKDGKADFVSFGRPLIADPYFPIKAQEGRPEDIVPCIRCLDCVTRGVMVGSVNCSVNVTVGQEGQFRITPTAKPKKVAVIGGGPGGMEAARVAALRGHEVTLFEKRKLGGLLIEASVPDFKADLRRLIEYLANQIKKTGVKVVSGEASVQTIKDGNFDAVIVATGGVPQVPDILRGLDEPCIVSALDVLGGAKTGDSVIVIGGGRIGCDVGLMLAEQGKKVTITTRGDAIARGFNQAEHIVFFKRLSKQNVEILTGQHLVEISGNSAMFYNNSGTRNELKGDNIILAAGLNPNRKLFDELWQIPSLEIYAVGDCVEPRSIYDAVHEGYWAAFGI